MKRFVLIAIIVATLSLIVGYNFNFWMIWPVMGMVWLIAEQRDWPWLTSWGFAAFAGAAAFGVWQGGAAGWLLVSLVAALAAWDLAFFTRRLRQAGQTAPEPALSQAHLGRLAVVAASGLLLGGLALGLRFQLSFGWAIFLGLLAVIGLSRVIRSARRS
jgi:hypothetical protein